MCKRCKGSRASDRPGWCACLAGILLDSAQGDAAAALQTEGAPLQQACCMAQCGPHNLQAVLCRMLQEVTAVALGGGETSGSGSKRQREAGTSGRACHTDGTTGSQA